MRYNIYFIVILIFFFNFSKVLAENKIVFIDINFVLEESNEGKKILKELDDLNKKNMKYFQDETSKLKKNEQEIIKLKNILSEKDYNKKINLFKKDVDKYNQEKKKILNSLETTKENKMNVFFDNLNLVLRKYMQENSINLIIDKKNVIMADNKNNISKEILELMNNYE
jgi:outer membrane protein